MALSATKWAAGDAVIKSAADTAGFVPEVWSDEIVASYKKNLVVANLIKRMNFKGKKGDAVTFPAPGRGTAAAKVVESQVTLQGMTGTGIKINIDKHYEYSRLIEDLAEVQALSSLRRFYTDDAGYALATQIDSDLLLNFAKAQGGAGSATWDKAVIGGDGSTLYNSGSPNSTAITDAGIRQVIQTLDDQDVPMDGRSLVIPPVARKTLLGLARFTEQAFTGEAGGANSIRNGQIGDIYGVKVYVSTNCPTATGSARIGVMFHPEYGVLIEQLGVRVQTQYKQEYLATLLTADTLYGLGELRDKSAVAIAMPA
jgi:N4-gp56 family major capsid protein